MPRAHRPTLLTVASSSLHAAIHSSIPARRGGDLLPASFCRFLSMLDTQDAQVMPLTCRKHFCGATVSEARGDLDTRPGLWFVGRPPGWGVPFCTDTGAPAAVCPVALPALWFPAWVLEQFSRIECHKSFKLEEWIIFFPEQEAQA